MVAEGDLVASHWTARATHQGELMGAPPTGTAVTITGTAIDRVAGGMIMESWVNTDHLGLLQQIGALPTSGASATP